MTQSTVFGAGNQDLGNFEQCSEELEIFGFDRPLKQLMNMAVNDLDVEIAQISVLIHRRIIASVEGSKKGSTLIGHCAMKVWKLRTPEVIQR
jgi:hypothetical protein